MHKPCHPVTQSVYSWISIERKKSTCTHAHKVWVQNSYNIGNGKEFGESPVKGIGMSTGGSGWVMTISVLFIMEIISHNSWQIYLYRLLKHVKVTKKVLKETFLELKTKEILKI